MRPSKKLKRGMPTEPQTRTLRSLSAKGQPGGTNQPRRRSVRSKAECATLRSPASGLRLTVGTITGLVAAGHSWDRILQMYPFLEMEDISAALAYATRLAEAYDIKLPSAA